MFCRFLVSKAYVNFFLSICFIIPYKIFAYNLALCFIRWFIWKICSKKAGKFETVGRSLLSCERKPESWHFNLWAVGDSLQSPHRSGVAALCPSSVEEWEIFSRNPWQAGQAPGGGTRLIGCLVVFKWKWFSLVCEFILWWWTRVKERIYGLGELRKGCHSKYGLLCCRLRYIVSTKS